MIDCDLVDETLLQARKHILEIHTRDWNPKLAEPFVEELAEKCVGKSPVWNFHEKWFQQIIFVKTLFFAALKLTQSMI